MSKKPNIPFRYLETVVLSHEGDECLIWPFYRNNMGYGTVNAAGRTSIVSRVVCERVHGAPPTPKHQAAHECGRGKFGCVSPHHLSWKTRLENEADKIVHGTLLRGEKASSVKLSEQDVAEIRRLSGKERQVDLAARYGVVRSAISLIQSGRRWAHIPCAEKQKTFCIRCGARFEGRPHRKYCGEDCRYRHRLVSDRAYGDRRFQDARDRLGRTV